MSRAGFPFLFLRYKFICYKVKIKWGFRMTLKEIHIRFTSAHCRCWLHTKRQRKKKAYEKSYTQIGKSTDAFILKLSQIKTFNSRLTNENFYNKPVTSHSQTDGQTSRQTHRLFWITYRDVKRTDIFPVWSAVSLLECVSVLSVREWIPQSSEMQQ